jgi:hypothetical protein
MAKRREIDNAMPKRREIDNTMTKRRKIDNTMAKRRKIDNTIRQIPHLEQELFMLIIPEHLSSPLVFNGALLDL